MTTRYYVINGECRIYSDWHYNYGYTMHPTVPTTFASAVNDTWGDEIGLGYIDKQNPQFSSWSSWCPGIPGWWSLNQMALKGAFPASATVFQMIKGGVISNAASLTDDGTEYILLGGSLSDGWRTRAVVESEGWADYSDNTIDLILVDGVTSEIIGTMSYPKNTQYIIGSVMMPSQEIILA